MDCRKKTVLVLIAALIIVCNIVSASTVTFVDSAYLGNGTLSISAPNGTPLTILNSTESYSVQNKTAYSFDYQPGGLYALHQEVVLGYVNGNITMPEFNGVYFYFSYFSKPLNILMAIWIIFLIILVVVI
jgi:hypothetical protein